MRAADYLARTTSQHRTKPKFAAAILALTEGFAQAVEVALGLPGDFDLDAAAGAQLDVVGLWVGVARRVAVPLTDVYFTWDGATSVGWDYANWIGAFDPTTGLTELDDGSYRTLIRAKIAANNWDGTTGSMHAFWEFVFGPGVIQIQDNQDMTITIIYDDLQLTTVQKAMLLNGMYPLKPMGVLVSYTAASSSPLFAWDRNLAKFKGWEQGNWT